MSNSRRHNAFLSSWRTFCYQLFEVALSWSGTPSIFSHLGYFCSHISSPVSPFPRSWPLRNEDCKFVEWEAEIGKGLRSLSSRSSLCNAEYPNLGLV